MRKEEREKGNEENFESKATIEAIKRREEFRIC